MRRLRSKWMMLAAVFATGGALFALTSGGCASALGEGALTAVNWCWIVDCQNGFGGGLILPCGDPTTAADDILADCPSPISTDTGGTTTP